MPYALFPLHGFVKCYACAHTFLSKLSEYPEQLYIFSVSLRLKRLALLLVWLSQNFSLFERNTTNSSWGTNLVFFFPFSFLPSPSCRLGASVEHTAAEAMRGMNLRAGGILLFTVLGLVLGSLQGSVNTSCHMNVNISGWLQMRSQGVSGCFGNQPVPLFLPVANNRVLLGADHCLWTKGLQKLLCGKWWVGWKKGVKW